MRKIVLTFGFLSGAVASVLMVLSLLFAKRLGFEHSLWLGYTTIVASMLLVYFGVRSYRDNVGHGSITFGRAFSVGLVIALISCICYVVTWEIIYFGFMPDFMDKYNAYVLARAKAAGASPAYLAAKANELARSRKLYDNPFVNVAMTFIEPLPVGVLAALLSAAILRRRARAAFPAPQV